MTTAIDTSIVGPGAAPSAEGDTSPPIAGDRTVNVRDAAVAFALSGISLESARALVKTMQDRRRERIAAQLSSEAERARIAETRTEERRSEAEGERKTAEHQLRKRNELEERVRDLGDQIRRARHLKEGEKIAQELDRLDTERKDTIERLGREHALSHDVEMEAWTARSAERDAEVEELKSTRQHLAHAHEEARASARTRMNGWMTRTAAGFLVWAGYAVIGTTGVAVSSLLDDSDDRSVLTDIGASAAKVMSELQGTDMHPLIAAAAGLLAFLASIVVLLVLMDLLMRWFDKRWLDVEASEPAQPQYGLTRRAELGRSTFSKLLVAIPFVYVTGLLVAFVAYGGQPLSNRLLLGEAASVLNALIGSALSLLSASIFLLYFANILEPRDSAHGSRWRMVWEIGIVPFVMIGAVVLVAMYGPSSRGSWAGVTAFMLLGAMALAYGLLYRGMFRDLDYRARMVSDCDRRIASIRRPPRHSEPTRLERKLIERALADYRERRQRLLDLDRERRLRRLFLTSDSLDTSLAASIAIRPAGLWNRILRRPRTEPQPDFYRTTDFEAAPAETEERREVEKRIREINLDLVIRDADAARARQDVLTRELDAAREAAARAARDHQMTLPLTDEREATESLELEQAFQMALSIKSSYDVIAKRREETIRKVERPTTKRSARVLGQEVPSEH
jgi:hypothetical protein